MSRAFQFNKRMQYDTVYDAGQIVDHLSEADTENLRLGGFGDYVEQETIDATDYPATVEPQDTSGEGSDDPAEPPAAEPQALVCEVCADGREFATAAALGSHRRAKHG